jgi:hypothetical protein
MDKVGRVSSSAKTFVGVSTDVQLVNLAADDRDLREGILQLCDNQPDARCFKVGNVETREEKLGKNIYGG